MLTPAGHIPYKGIQKKKWQLGIFRMSKKDDQWLETIMADTNAQIHTEEVRALVRRLPLIERKIKERKVNLQTAPLLSTATTQQTPADSESGAPLDAYKRFCHKCMLFKPDRCHHCRVCKTCVLRMDHHCPWIMNCVGYRNYKFFMLALIYGNICLLFMLIHCGPAFVRSIDKNIDRTYLDNIVLIAYLIMLLLFPVLFSFFCSHFYLSARALTTIEYHEKRNHEIPLVRHRFQLTHLKYDNGLWKNLYHIFGPWYSALFPVEWPNAHVDDGTYSDDYVMYIQHLDQQNAKKKKANRHTMSANTETSHTSTPAAIVVPTPTNTHITSSTVPGGSGLAAPVTPSSTSPALATSALPGSAPHNDAFVSIPSNS